NLGLGTDPGLTHRNVDGLVDEVEIFNRALSQAESHSIVNAGNAGKCKPCVTPPPNMVSWWPGDGNANDIQDGNNGTLQGGATFAAGKVAQAFSFDGVNGSVTVPDSANLDITGPLTIDVWVNVTAINQALNKAILWKGNNLGQDATSSY